jgi:hypothetical protein
MTEAEWLASATPWRMLTFVGEGASARKLRLFTCACCRQVLNPFAPPFVERGVRAAEAFADREITSERLARVGESVGAAVGPARDGDVQHGTGYLSHLLDAVEAACWRDDELEAAQDAALATARAAADVPWPVTTRAQPSEFASELAGQADLLRDIFGNPFRPSELRPEWLTSTVVALAQGIYADYAFDRMPILADALQDAGCDDDGILSHCREPREHARGCWGVDLLLGKK